MGVDYLKKVGLEMTVLREGKTGKGSDMPGTLPGFSDRASRKGQWRQRMSVVAPPPHTESSQKGGL